MVGAHVHTVSMEARAGDGPVMLAVSGLTLPAGGPFGVPLRSVSIEVRAGEVVANRGGGGQRTVRALRGVVGVNGSRRRRRPSPWPASPAGTRGVTARRRLGAAFVPEERLGHSAVPGFVLSEKRTPHPARLRARDGARGVRHPARDPDGRASRQHPLRRAHEPRESGGERALRRQSPEVRGRARARPRSEGGGGDRPADLGGGRGRRRAHPPGARGTWRGPASRCWW